MNILWLKKTDLKKIIDNKRIKDLFTGENAVEKLSMATEISLTILSEDFIEKIDQFEWDKEDKIDFISDMRFFTPERRKNILKEMLEKSKMNPGEVEST